MKIALSTLQARHPAAAPRAAPVLRVAHLDVREVFVLLAPVVVADDQRRGNASAVRAEFLCSKRSGDASEASKNVTKTSDESSECAKDTSVGEAVVMNQRGALTAFVDGARRLHGSDEPVWIESLGCARHARMRLIHSITRIVTEAGTARRIPLREVRELCV